MPTPKKAATINELTDLLRNSSLTVLTDYRGMSVSEITDLRRQLRAKKVKFHVTKNTLTMRAAKEVGVVPLQEGLMGPTAIAFIGADDLAAGAKTLTDFAKTSKVFKIRSGVLQGKVISADQLTDLANLPSREELVARMLGQLNAPITQFLTVLNGPIRSMAYVLQARIDQLNGGTESASAEETA